MPVPTERIIELLSTLACDEKMKVTIKQSLRGGLIAGGMAFAGGVLGGPLGIFIGASVGGCIAAATSTKFVSVVEILASMEPERKEHLAREVRRIMGNIGVADIVVFAGMIGSNPAIRQEVANVLIDHLRNEMQMQIADR